VLRDEKSMVRRLGNPVSERLTERELAMLQPAETLLPSPIPTRVVSNGEFLPARQNEAQRRVESRIRELADALGGRRGKSRRDFLQTASGMAAAFLAMNEVYGPVFHVTAAEAATPEMAEERALGLAGQFILDVHTHFLRDDTRLQYFVDLRTATGKRGFNPELAKHAQTFEDVKFPTYIKEVYLDSDTKVALLSGAPSDIPQDWFLSNDRIAGARTQINRFAGSRRMLAHFVFTPGQRGWLEAIDRGVEVLKPDAWKGYTIGDNTHKEISRHPWRMDDEKVVYKGYEKFAKADIRNVAVHKGLFPPSDEERFGRLTEYARVDDVGKAARDWPQLNFLIYHAGYRYTGDHNPALAAQQFEQTGRMDWVSDLAEIPQKYGVGNVYADVGASFAALCISHPRAAAAMMAILVKGLGADHVLWGTDSIWFGSPQWQIEALRRLEVPEDMAENHSFAPLGPADGQVKSAIFGYNAARLHRVELRADAGWRSDALAASKAAYMSAGPRPSNRAYGYVRRDA
jgi:uncharacterized protein